MADTPPPQHRIFEIGQWHFWPPGYHSDYPHGTVYDRSTNEWHSFHSFTHVKQFLMFNNAHELTHFIPDDEDAGQHDLQSGRSDPSHGHRRLPRLHRGTRSTEPAAASSDESNGDDGSESADTMASLPSTANQHISSAIPSQQHQGGGSILANIIASVQASRPADASLQSKPNQVRSWLNYIGRALIDARELVVIADLAGILRTCEMGVCPTTIPPHTFCGLQSSHYEEGAFQSIVEKANERLGFVSNCKRNNSLDSELYDKLLGEVKNGDGSIVYSQTQQSRSGRSSRAIGLIVREASPEYYLCFGIAAAAAERPSMFGSHRLGTYDANYVEAVRYLELILSNNNATKLLASKVQEWCDYYGFRYDQDVLLKIDHLFKADNRRHAISLDASNREERYARKDAWPTLEWENKRRGHE